MPRTLTAQTIEQELLGYFRIFVTPPGGFQQEITLFRDAPVQIGTVTTQDPFTESTASLTFPQITVFDTPGEGDLNWLVVNTDVDIIWQNVGGYDFDWRWEGFIASYSFSLSGQDSTFTMDLKGAFYALDDYLAIPAFPKRPIPYEILIAKAFDQAEHPAHLGKFRVVFPSDWASDPKHKVPAFADPTYLIALKPWGVATGNLWTGFTSRSTGAWDPLLSGHVQTMLSIMFAEGGSQWTIRNRGQRRPELFLRRIPDSEDDRIIEIVLGAPGVALDGSRDYTQRAGVIYGSGQDENGIVYSNIQITPDGRTTYFQPFAYSNRMWPRLSNPNYDPNIRPKETRIDFEQGIDEISAFKVAQGQYQRFAEPGISGSITLTTDVRLSNGQLMPRLMIRAGQSIRIKGLFGVREGVMAHVTQANADFTNLTTTLTYDSKYKDQLTVEEVMARNRDALRPIHSLKVGTDSNTIDDLVLPWSYKAGSGIVPLPAKDFYAKLPANATFPFEEYTRLYPPKSPSYKNFYIRIGPTDTSNSNNNWSYESRHGIATACIPIRMGQVGTIRHSEMAAYDKDGNVMRVKFHLSVYDSNGIAVHSMPQFPGAGEIPGPATGWKIGAPFYNPPDQHIYNQDNPPGPGAKPPPKENDVWIKSSNGVMYHYQVVLIVNEDFPDYLPARQKGIEGVLDADRPVIPTTYSTTKIDGEWTAQSHPFYQGAWEKMQPDGTEWPWDIDISIPNPPPVVGWGTYYEPAGYWPGRKSRGAQRTGLFQDDATWDFNLNSTGLINTSDPTQNEYQEYAGMLFVMIYCDDQNDEPVYFMGRFIRTDPSSKG